MLPNLQITRTLVENARMSSSKKSVTPAAIQQEWLEIQAAQQNPALFRPLYDRYFESIFRFIYRRTADEMLTGDLSSQVFLKAMQRLKEYRFKGVPFSAWLFRIALNEIAQHYRQVQKNRVVSMEETSLQDMADEIQETADEPQLFSLIKALDQLGEDDLLLIEMRFFEQRPFKEIAEILGMTESNAKVKTYRILERLKKKIQP